MPRGDPLQRRRVRPGLPHPQGTNQPLRIPACSRPRLLLELREPGSSVVQVHSLDVVRRGAPRHAPEGREVARFGPLGIRPLVGRLAAHDFGHVVGPRGRREDVGPRRRGLASGLLHVLRLHREPRQPVLQPRRGQLQGMLGELWHTARECLLAAGLRLLRGRRLHGLGSSTPQHGCQGVYHGHELVRGQGLCGCGRRLQVCHGRQLVDGRRDHAQVQRPRLGRGCLDQRLRCAAGQPPVR
mmetsp:Transcript_22275/g.57969  ORF Transcript_22275/g.57969 Transcript_22275/m.57969 type:complete len:241 (-) Transcript_22275:47-769(-)